MKNIFKGATFVVLGFICLAHFNGCRKIDVETSTTSVLNIYPYVKNNATQFSDWAKIIDKSGFAGFLTAYGGYTMFAPTNDAIKLYLKDVNKNSVDDFSEAEAKDLVKFHLLEDTLTTSSFKDGKLPTITMYGQYLVSGVENNGGVSSITVNRQAIITQANIITGNGYIHVVDHVLKPAVKSSAQLISENPNFSIFKEALIATGFYDTLNIVSTANPKRFYTVLTETNKALADSGFTSYAALFNRLSNTRNPRNPSDSLYIFVAYHIIPEAKYLADIASGSSQFTAQPLEILSTTLDGQTVLINDLEFNGVREPGIALDRANSDISTTTGVLHVATGHFRPKVRVPFPVYWDVADFPEVRKLPAIFRKTNLDFAFGTLKDFAWNNPANTLSYSYTTSSSVSVFWNDYLTVPMGTTSRHNWIEFKTPLLVKGKYKVWVCYRAAKGSGTVTTTTPTGGSNCPVQVSFNGQITERPFNFCIMRPTGSDGELEALGWKRYTVDSTTQFMSGKYIGAVDVASTGRHTVRFDVLPAAGTGNPSNFLDMIHFIPIDWPSQYLPRFGRDGSLLYY